MTAETIVRALGGRKAGLGWMARCPAHDDREPSLSIREADGKVLVRCHAGCDQRDVIAALKETGLWSGKASSRIRRLSHRKVPEIRPNQQHEERSTAALAIWQSTALAVGTPVETYLSARGLNLWLPPTLRFHRGLKHPSGGIWPCMVALVTRGADNAPLAIHRTFLARDGGGKAPINPAKMMLGPCRGGAIRLSQPGDMLMVGEGIETCLAAMQATGHPAWAALSCPSHLFHLSQKPWNFASPPDTLSGMHKIIEIFADRAALHTEILALRQQVAVLKRKRPRPSLRRQIGFSGSSCLAYGLAGATPW